MAARKTTARAASPSVVEKAQLELELAASLIELVNAGIITINEARGRLNLLPAGEVCDLLYLPDPPSNGFAVPDDARNAADGEVEDRPPRRAGMGALLRAGG